MEEQNMHEHGGEKSQTRPNRCSVPKYKGLATLPTTDNRCYAQQLRSFLKMHIIIY